jgi:hypothetical protein
MGIRDFLSRIIGGAEHKEASPAEEYVELQIPEGEYKAQAPSRFVKVCKLKGFADVDAVVRELGDGNIVVLDIKPLAERSMNELKHAVDEVKDICLSVGGDIAGLSEYHLIITPPGIKIERAPGTRAEGFEATIEKIRKRA